MTDFSEGRLKPMISDLVLSEIQAAPEHLRSKCAELLTFVHECVKVDDRALNLLDLYQKHLVLPNTFRYDMLHIAIATVVPADTFASWDFQYILHFERVKEFNRINVKAGYESLSMNCPDEVFIYGGN